MNNPVPERLTNELEISASDAPKAARPLFDIPAGSTVPPPARRTWEGYASDFRDLTAQLAGLQQQRDALRAEHVNLQELYSALQRQRRDDRDRLALSIRARTALEASSGGQIARMRAAQMALADRDATIAQLEESCHRLTDELSARRVKIDELQTHLNELSHINANLSRTNADLSRTNDELSRAKQVALNELVQYTERTRVAEEAHDRIIAEKAIVDRIVPVDIGALPAARITSLRARPSFLDRVIVPLSLWRARAAARQGNWALAEALYAVVLMARDEPGLWNQLGHALREQNLFGSAAAAYRKAIERDSRNGETFVMLGISEAGRQNETGARDAYLKALELDPGLKNVFGELRALVADA